MTNTLEVLERIARYAETLPSAEVQIDMYSVLGAPPEMIDPASARDDIEYFYGTPDKAPAWLRTLSQAQPGKLEAACAKAREELAREIDAEVEK